MKKRRWMLVAGALAGVLCGWALFSSLNPEEMWWAFVRWNIKDLPESLDGPDLAWCVANDSSRYRMVVEPPQPEPWDDVTLRIFDGEVEAFHWSSSPAVPFVRDGDTLYLADFSPISSGCRVLAYDLAGRKQLWRAGLKGLGPVDHSKYRNSVTIKVRNGIVEIHSVESYGEYFEELDAKTGATVGHRIVWRY
jgi:hypothetical protein